MSDAVAEPLITVAGSEDERELAGFRCAREGLTYEEQVESFVRGRLLFGPPLSELRAYQAFTLRSAGDLVGAMAVRQWPEAPDGGVELVVGALSLDVQGLRSPTGEPLARFLMRALVQAATEANHGPLISGIVARENIRSLNMCRRAGLTCALDHDVDHVRMVGVLSQP